MRNVNESDNVFKIKEAVDKYGYAVVFDSEHKWFTRIEAYVTHGGVTTFFEDGITVSDTSNRFVFKPS